MLSSLNTAHEPTSEVRVADARLLTSIHLSFTYKIRYNKSIPLAQATTHRLTSNPSRHCYNRPFLSLYITHVSFSFQQVMTYRQPFDPNIDSVSVLLYCALLIYLRPRRSCHDPYDQPLEQIRCFRTNTGSIFIDSRFVGI